MTWHLASKGQGVIFLVLGKGAGEHDYPIVAYTRRDLAEEHAHRAQQWEETWRDHDPGHPIRIAWVRWSEMRNPFDAPDQQPFVVGERFFVREVEATPAGIACLDQRDESNDDWWDRQDLSAIR